MRACAAAGALEDVSKAKEAIATDTATSLCILWCCAQCVQGHVELRKWFRITSKPINE
jgi:hypothetical protein